MDLIGAAVEHPQRWRGRSRCVSSIRHQSGITAESSRLRQRAGCASTALPGDYLAYADPFWADASVRLGSARLTR